MKYNEEWKMELGMIGLGRMGLNMSKRLIFGSVSSNKNHFRSGINDMKAIKQKYENILEKLITKKVSPPEFKQAFKPEREDIKTIIYFQ